EGRAVKDGDRAPFERDGTDMSLYVIMERQHAQKQVDGRDTPAQPGLAVPFGVLEVHSAELDALRQCREHVPRALRTDEHVDVDVSGTAGFERAVAERDRAADRMRDASCVEPVVDREQLIAELAHERSRISGGYSSSGRGR